MNARLAVSTAPAPWESRAHRARTQMRVLWVRAGLLLERLKPRDTGDERPRYVSVDAVRALAVAGMLLVNNHAYGTYGEVQLRHVPWHGLRLADVVFPAFLFVVGISMALSFARKTDQPWLKVWGRFAARVVALLAIGLVLNQYKYGEPLRYMGVLQRIALASLIAAPLARRKPVFPALLGMMLLLAHTWFLLEGTGPGVVPGSFARDTSFALWVDTRAFGLEHLYKQRFDPEGLLGVVSSAGQVMLGIAVGGAMARWPRSPRIPVYLFLAAVSAIFAGMWFDQWIPVNKNLWTATFVLLTSGLTLALLAAFFALADLYRFDRPLQPLVPLGRNALAVYIGSIALALWLQGLAVTGVIGDASNAYEVLSLASIATFGEYWGAITFSAAHVVVWYAIAAVLHQARVYIKL